MSRKKLALFIMILMVISLTVGVYKASAQMNPLNYWGSMMSGSNLDWVVNGPGGGENNITCQAVTPATTSGQITAVMFYGSASGSGTGVVALANTYNGAWLWSTSFSLSTVTNGLNTFTLSSPISIPSKVYIVVAVTTGTGGITVLGSSYAFNTNEALWTYFVPGAGGSDSNTWQNIGGDYLEAGIQISSSITQYTITASSDSNGVIIPRASLEPSNTLSFASGDSQTFYFKAAQGYYVYTCWVDGSPVNLNAITGLPLGYADATYTASGELVNPWYSYTFNDISQTHTISIQDEPLANFIANPNFQPSFANWTTTGSASLVTSQFYAGVTCCKVTYVGWVNQTLITTIPVSEITDFNVANRVRTGTTDTALDVVVKFTDGSSWGGAYDWAVGYNFNYLDLTADLDANVAAKTVSGIDIGAATVSGQSVEVYNASLLVDAPPLGQSSYPSPTPVPSPSPSSTPGNGNGGGGGGGGGGGPGGQPTPTPTSSSTSTNSTNPISKLWGGFVSTVSKLPSILSSIWRKIPTLLQDLMTAFLVLMLLFLLAAAVNRRDKNRRTSRPRIRVMEKIGTLLSSNFVKGTCSFS